MDNIDRALKAIKTERMLDRLNPQHPTCPGCGRKERVDLLSLPVNLLTGATQLCCAECSDDESANLTLNTYRQDLLDNWQPLSHAAISTHYRGISLPPNFYNGMDVE